MSMAIRTPELYPIKPAHINTDGHFFGAFDHTETEISACCIVRFMQSGPGQWRPFTHEEISSFSGARHGFPFNRLAPAGHADGKWLVQNGPLLFVTHAFVCRCFQASPKKGLGIGS